MDGYFKIGQVEEYKKMAGWHHWLIGHEFEQDLGVGDGQRSLLCCNQWGCKSQTWLNNWTIATIYIKKKKTLILYYFMELRISSKWVLQVLEGLLSSWPWVCDLLENSIRVRLEPFRLCLPLTPKIKKHSKIPLCPY